MLEPRMVEGPVLSPGTCLICGGAAGRMLDTMVSKKPYGRVYVCERICLPLIARAAGYATPEQVHRWGVAVNDALVREAELKEQLDAAEASKTLDAEATIAYITAHRPGPKPKATA